jgi:hypothetical protein
MVGAVTEPVLHVTVTVTALVSIDASNWLVGKVRVLESTEQI